MKDKRRILVVDDDPAVSQMLARALVRRSYEVEATNSADEALARFAARACDAAILDLVMPEKDGVELARALRDQVPGLPIAILTGYVHSPLLSETERPRIAVFKKPIVIQDVIDFLAAELGQRVTERLRRSR
jgi:DNA-binding NtrC family response regulator